MFEKLTEEMRALYVESIVTCTIKEREKERQGEDIVLDVYLKNIHFIDCRTEKEMVRIAELVFDIMEELKKLNNDGMNATKLKELAINDMDPHEEAVERIIAIYNTLDTPELKKAIQELMWVSGVGGAYDLIIARPQFMNILYACYEVVVDRFDDEKAYYQVADFLFRGALYVRHILDKPENTN